MSANRVTGLQTAHAGIVAMLERWREQLPPRDYAVLTELVARWLELERQRNEQARRRWAA